MDYRPTNLEGIVKISMARGRAATRLRVPASDRARRGAGPLNPRQVKWRTVDESRTHHLFDRVEIDDHGIAVYASACGLRLDRLGGHRRRRPPLLHRCEKCNEAEMAAAGRRAPLPADEEWDRRC